MKNRMREICTSGSVRGGDGNVPTYSAAFVTDRREVVLEDPTVGEWCEVAEEGKPAGVVERDQSGEEQTTEQLAEDAHRTGQKCPAAKISSRSPSSAMPPPGTIICTWG